MMRTHSMPIFALLATSLGMNQSAKPQQETWETRWQRQEDLDKRLNAATARRRQTLSTKLVVMIDGRLGDLDQFGAGIIFGRDRDRLYIATANHLVRTRTGEATNLQVRFKTFPQKRFAARLLPRADPSQDVAALAVDGLAAEGIDICALSLGLLGTASSVRRGVEVIPVGNPSGEAWAEPVRPDTVSKIDGDQIVFLSTFIGPGHSGGGLLDATGRLIGMIQFDQPPYGRARDIHNVLGILKSWNYPVDLYTDGGDPPLFSAIEQGDLAAARNLLGHVCTDVNALVRKEFYASVGTTALHRAAWTGRKDLVEMVLDAGAKVDAKDDQGATPLMHAAGAKGAGVDVLRVLLEHGANVNQNSGYATALVAATEAGKLEAVRFLLANGADPNNPGRERKTAIFSAIGKNDDHERSQILRTLIQAGANVNWKDSGGRTPLLDAVSSRENTSAIRMLLEAGADARVRDNNGRCAIFSVFDEEVAVLLLQHTSKITREDGEDLIYEVARKRWFEGMRLLFSRGADIKGKAARGEFIGAAERMDLDMVRTLLECGADPNGEGRDSPLLAVVDSHYRLPDEGFRILEMLVSKGANVNAGHPLRNVLYLASSPDLRTLEFLVSHGAEVRLEDIDHARRMTNQAVVDVLLKAKPLHNR